MRQLTRYCIRISRVDECFILGVLSLRKWPAYAQRMVVTCPEHGLRIPCTLPADPLHIAWESYSLQGNT